MHTQFLLAALDQAWLGQGFCSPNPSVGAVAVQNDTIIAQAWHRGAGTAHAEILLLEQLPENCAEFTFYVTLEPCNHWGRTSPCVDALIKRNVGRVVYGYSDPNPVVAANNTPLILKEHGIDVLHLPLPEIDQFYESYRYWSLLKKPWVNVKIAQTFDGKCAGENHQRVQLSNELCAQFTHQQRLYCDIILTTARTINQDDPWLNVRLADKTIAKPVAIIDANLSSNPNAKVFTAASHCHIYHQPDTVVAEKTNCSFHAMPSQSGLLDLNAIISHLGALGYHTIWVEAGGHLFSVLHQERLVNRTYIYLVPQSLGNNAVPVYHGAHLIDDARSVTWQAKNDNMIAVLEW